MGRKLLPIYATTGDLLQLLSAAESKMAMEFYVAGLVEKSAAHRSLTSGEVLHAIEASGKVYPMFLVVPAATTVNVEEIPQRKGGVHYLVGNQNYNPNSIIVHPCELINPTMLLKGQIGTISDTPESLALFATFAKVLRKQFTKVKSYWVGPEAIRILDSGGRLAITDKSPPEYDLKR
jgi:hypothetical protein